MKKYTRKTKNRIKKNRKKTAKKSVKNKREAKKYIDLLNLSLTHISRNFTYEFTEDDYILYSYLKQGFKKGWNVLKNKNIIKELSCNSLCMTISILNSIISRHKKIEDLKPIEKMYLFFISYLIDDTKLKKKDVTLFHALKKIDIRILNEKRRYEKYEREKNNRGMKKSKKYIESQEEKKKQLLDSNGQNKDGINSVFKLDVCSSIDCEFLHEYKMSKGEKWSASYSKFCLHITEIFKGIVWLNMCIIFSNTKNPYKILSGTDKLNINLNIRGRLKAVDILLVPSEKIYTGDLFYDDTFIDENRKEGIKFNKFWVFKDFDLKNGSCKKVGISGLENKHYVMAFLNLDTDYRKSKEQQLKEAYDKFNDFLHNKGPLPILKDIYKRTKNIGDQRKLDLSENIENSITSHWIFIHRDRMNDMIEEWVI